MHVLPLLFILAHQPTASSELTRFQEAKRQYDLGDFAAAARSFDALYQTSGKPELLFDSAQSHRQAGGHEHRTKALATYKAYLREVPNAPNRAFVERMISTLSREQPRTEVLTVPLPSEPTEPLEDPFALPLAPAVPASASTHFTPPPRRWIATGVVGVLALSSILSSLYTQSLYNDLHNGCGAEPAHCTNAEVDQLRGRALVTNVLWTATGVAAVATGVLFYLDVGRETKGVALAVRF